MRTHQEVAEIHRSRNYDVVTSQDLAAASTWQIRGWAADCTAALRPLVADIATAEPEALISALNGKINSLEMDTALDSVIEAAKSAGWGSEEIGNAVMRLAREYEGAKGAIFD